MNSPATSILGLTPHARPRGADGAGRGVAAATRFVYDGQDIVLAFTGTGSLANRYLQGPVIDQILADEDATNSVLWPLVDNLGTVRDLVNSSGTVQNHLKYDAYGNVVSESNAAIDHIFGYTGREREEDTGLMYYRARYYDAAAGKFLSEDPLGFGAGDTNLSRYVFNSPTNLTDPSGLDPLFGQTQGMPLTPPGPPLTGWTVSPAPGAGRGSIGSGSWQTRAGNPGGGPPQLGSTLPPSAPPFSIGPGGVLFMSGLVVAGSGGLYGWGALWQSFQNVGAYGASYELSPMGFSAHYSESQSERDHYRWWHGMAGTQVNPHISANSFWQHYGYYLNPNNNGPGGSGWWAAGKWLGWGMAAGASVWLSVIYAPVAGAAAASWWQGLAAPVLTFGIGTGTPALALAGGGSIGGATAVTITGQQVVVVGGTLWGSILMWMAGTAGGGGGGSAGDVETAKALQASLDQLNKMLLDVRARGLNPELIDDLTTTIARLTIEMYKLFSVGG